MSLPQVAYNPHLLLCFSPPHTKGICKAGRGRSTSAGNKKPLCFLRKYDGFSLFWRFLVYLFSLVFLEGEGGKRLWAFCPQCSFRLLNLEWAEYQNAFCIPQGEGSIDGGSPTWHLCCLCSCFVVLSTYNWWWGISGICVISRQLAWSWPCWSSSKGTRVGWRPSLAPLERARLTARQSWKCHQNMVISYLFAYYKLMTYLPSPKGQLYNLCVSVRIDLQQPPWTQIVCRLFAADTDTNLTWIHPEGHWCFGNISREAASGQPDSQIYSGWEQWHHGVIKNNSVKDHNETVLQPTNIKIFIPSSFIIVRRKTSTFSNKPFKASKIHDIQNIKTSRQILRENVSQPFAHPSLHPGSWFPSWQRKRLSKHRLKPNIWPMNWKPNWHLPRPSVDRWIVEEDLKIDLFGCVMKKLSNFAT